jgi:hypothetical protein
MFRRAARLAGMTIDQDKLNAFLGKVVGDVGSAMSASLVVLGDNIAEPEEVASVADAA